LRKLIGDTPELIERERFQRLAVEEGAGTGLAEQIAPVSDLDENHPGQVRTGGPAHHPLREAIGIRQKDRLG
jgi:hypothetical protein